MADDDFWSDGDASGSPRDTTTNSLQPIVEVPTGSERSDSVAPSLTDRSEVRAMQSPDEEDISEEEEQEIPDTSRSKTSPNKSKKKRDKSNKHIDMTPPDKLLKKAEKKAKQYVAKNKNSHALREYIRCTALARIVYGDEHWKYVKANVDLAGAYLDLKGYHVQALYHCDNAKKLIVNIEPDDTCRHHVSEVQINIHYIIGRAMMLTNKHAAAETALLRAENIAKERAKNPAVSEDSIEKWQIKIYLAIARLGGKSKKHALSIAYFEKAMRVLENRYGPDSMELVPVYQGLGKVEQSKGKNADHDKAIENFTQAHSITAANRDGDNTEALADSARALATAYANIGTIEAEISAESYLNEALIGYQKVHSNFHIKTLEVQDELARLMVRTDRQMEAIELLKSTMPERKELYGELSTPVADTWKLIGSAHLAKQETDKALRALKKCHSIECDIHGKNHKKSKDTERMLEILLANPSLAHKHGKGNALDSRPRFNTSSKTTAY